MNRFLNLFLIVLLVALVGQSLLWRFDSFTDDRFWTARVAQFRSDITTGEFEAWNEVYSGHPGMSVISIATVAHMLGASLAGSVDGAVALLNALAIAGIVTIAVWWRPTIGWWLPALAIGTFYPLYVYATPTNAVIAPMSILIVLGVLWLSESSFAFWKYAVVGAAVGLALITRVPTALLICLPLATWLASKQGLKPVGMVAGVAAATALVLDPFLWLDTVDHVSYVLFRSSLNVTGAVQDLPLDLMRFPTFAPLALLSIGLACVSLVYRKYTSPLPVSFVVTLLITTVLYTIVFLSVSYQSLRHFMPILLVWEILFPLYALQAIAQSKFAFSSSPLFWSAWARRITVALLVFSPTFLLILSFV